MGLLQETRISQEGNLRSCLSQMRRSVRPQVRARQRLQCCKPLRKQSAMLSAKDRQGHWKGC